MATPLHDEVRVSFAALAHDHPISTLPLKRFPQCSLLEYLEYLEYLGILWNGVYAVNFPIASPVPAFRCKISLDKQKQPPYTSTPRKQCLIQGDL